MLSSTACLLLIGGFFQGAVSAARILPRDGPTPALPYADDTTKYCIWWLDYESGGSCADMLEANLISLDEFRRWNPSVNADCGNLVVGKSYCIETADEPVASDPAPAPASSSTSSVRSSAVPTPSTFTTSSVPVVTSSASRSTPPSTTTTTSAGNGVETPQPTQPGMVSNCNKFHYIDQNTVCSQVLSYQKISVADLFRWNPSVNADCTGLQKLVNVCVGVIGGSTPTPSTTTPTPTPTATKGNNGVETPLPTQPGMVSNCAVFHYIGPNTVCSQVLSYQKISMEDLYRWNPSVNADCTGLQKLVNVCVRVIGATTTTPKPSTITTAGNGIQTPQPTQPGMVANCNKFHFINQGVVCSQVISYQKITREDFVKWNPTVNDDCSGMWANVNVCVGVIGGGASSPTPTTTTSPANGIQTPQPTQPGMTLNCKKFHYAAEGVVCSQLTSYNKISLADFVKWNPGVGSDCRTMWANTYFCVGV
ncbi:carbohydrate-binding module family 50 protein [Bipolaris victoriae FI3]|uniref:Carbohydrate-binding module family 50 protein n=1 Tax=Bipolaris victoriae (strain FI3) TaxID=930091 RepID=W7EZM9_BIPV3|nr:carbohydrate-binding module family 50 protein [Bipolaris victoriae FI3]